MSEIYFQQSKHWSTSKNIDWIINNALFAFTTSGHKGNRVRIKTRTPVDGYDCFEFDNDQYGIIITSWTTFSKFWEDCIVEQSSDVVKMLVDFLEIWGAGEFVNPKKNVRYFIGYVLGNHKIIKIQL